MYLNSLSTLTISSTHLFLMLALCFNTSNDTQDITISSSYIFIEERYQLETKGEYCFAILIHHLLQSSNERSCLRYR